MPYRLAKKIYQHKYLLIALCSIAVLCAWPIQTAIITHSENPGESGALTLTQTSSIIFTIPPHASPIHHLSVWTGDTLRTPANTILNLHVDGKQGLQVALKDILAGARELRFRVSLPASQEAIHATLSSENIPIAKPLLLRSYEKDEQSPALTLYGNVSALRALLQTMYAEDTTAGDIKYVWLEGNAVLHGENPYARASADSHSEGKFATYFPLSYIISASIQKMGFTEFEPWLATVRPIVLASQLLTAVTVLFFLYYNKQLALGLFGFFLILLHRFTLYPARVSHIDFPAILFLILGLLLLSKKPKTSYILIGISLAIKQMAIFIIPLILIWVWQKYKTVKSIIIAVILLGLVTAISMAPFILNNPSGVWYSMFYSAYRVSTGDFASPDVSSTLHLDGLTSRLPMIGMMLIIFIAFYKKEIRLYGACLAIFTIFIGFNPVLFFQYLAWIIPFIPLALTEATSRQHHKY